MFTTRQTIISSILFVLLIEVVHYSASFPIDNPNSEVLDEIKGPVNAIKKKLSDSNIPFLLLKKELWKLLLDKASDAVKQTYARGIEQREGIKNQILDGMNEIFALGKEQGEAIKNTALDAMHQTYAHGKEQVEGVQNKVLEAKDKIHALVKEQEEAIKNKVLDVLKPINTLLSKIGF